MKKRFCSAIFAIQANTISALMLDNSVRYDKCPLCASKDIQLVGPVEYRKPLVFADTPINLQYRPELWRCLTCASAFVMNVIDESVAAYLYGVKKSKRWTSTEPFVTRRPSEHAAFIVKLLRPGMAVLDIGCSEGQFLDFAASLGCETLGIEYSEAARSECRKRGHACFASLEEIPQAKRVDAIFAFDVVEHVYDVPRFINTYSSRLEAKGILVLLTGDALSLSAQLLKTRWWYVRYPEHITFPSLDYLNRLADMEVINILPTFALNWQKQKSARQILSIAYNFLRGNYDGQPPLIKDHMIVAMRKKDC